MAKCKELSWSALEALENETGLSVEKDLSIRQDDNPENGRV
jgi:hypothetical protein